MPTITINPISIDCLKTGCVEVLDRTGLTFVDKKLQEDVISHVVIGCGIDDRDGLFYAIRRAVKDFQSGLDSDGLRKREKISDNEREVIIKELVEKSEANLSSHYSRHCSICDTPSPDSRAVLTACGHVACLACVMRMEKWGRLPCPFCGIRTGYVKMIEEKEGEEKAMEGDNKIDGEKTVESMDSIDALLFSSTCDNPSTSLPTVLQPNVLSTVVLSPTVIQPTVSPHSPTPTAFPSSLTPPISPTHSSFPCSPSLDSSHSHPESQFTLPSPTESASKESEPSDSDVSESEHNAPSVSDSTVPLPTETTPIDLTPPSTRVHVTGFAANMSAHRLGRHFSQAGKVTYMDLPQNRFGLPWGFAFCQFADTDSAEKAVAMFNDSVFEECWLRVKMAS